MTNMRYVFSLTTSLVWAKQHHHHHWHHHPQHHQHFKDFPCLAFPWLPPCSELSSPDRRKWVGSYAVCTLFVSSPELSCWGHVSLIIVHHAIQRNGKAFALCMYPDAYLSEPACWGIYVLYIHLSIFVGFMYHHADQCYAMLGCMHSFSQFQGNWHVEEMYLCTMRAPKAHFDPRNISCSVARPRQSLFHGIFGNLFFFSRGGSQTFVHTFSGIWSDASSRGLSQCPKICLPIILKVFQPGKFAAAPGAVN